jgi:hypothetical protein
MKRNLTAGFFSWRQSKLGRPLTRQKAQETSLPPQSGYLGAGTVGLRQGKECPTCRVRMKEGPVGQGRMVGFAEKKGASRGTCWIFDGDRVASKMTLDLRKESQFTHTMTHCDTAGRAKQVCSRQIWKRGQDTLLNSEESQVQHGMQMTCKLCNYIYICNDIYTYIICIYMYIEGIHTHTHTHTHTYGDF